VTGSPTRLVTFRTGDDVGVGELQEDRVRVLAAPTMVDWLAGEARLATRVEHGREDVELLARPQPPFRSPDEGEVRLSAGHEA